MRIFWYLRLNSEMLHTPLWVISIISVVFSVISLINSFGSGTQEIFSAIFGLVISCGIFCLANNIRKNA